MRWRELVACAAREFKLEAYATRSGMWITIFESVLSGFASVVIRIHCYVAIIKVLKRIEFKLGLW